MSTFQFIFDVSQYHLNPYSLAPLLVATLVLVFGIFLYSLERNSTFNKVLLYFCFSTIVWLYSCVLLLNTKSSQLAYFWSHFLYLGFVFVPPTIFHLSVSLTRPSIWHRFIVIGFYLSAMILLPFCQSPYSFVDVKREFFGFYPIAGFLQPVIVFFFASAIVFGLFNLMYDHFSRQDFLERRGLKFFMFNFSVLSFSSLDILACFNNYLYPSGFIGFLGFIIGMTCFKLMFFATTIERHAQDLEKEVELKTRELSQVLQNLRTTQVQLLETGKKSALASLSAGLLHQISQPITAIHGFARFLKKEMKPTDPFYKPIYHIEEQSVYIKRMLEDLTNLVRHREILKENIDVNVVIKRATDLLTDELRIRRVQWDTQLAQGVPLVYADGVLLQQIFLNLILNALQAFENLPRGAPRYFKMSTQWDNVKREVIIAFEDTAPSLSMEERAVIGEPFFSTKSKISGLEIALCQDLIAEHGGSMEIQGTSGKGNKFILRFPISNSLVIPQEEKKLT